MNNHGNYRDIGDWFEEKTNLERKENLSGLVWPSSTVADVLAEEFEAEVLTVSPSARPRTGENNVYSYPRAKHHELSYEDLQDFDIEYGWALAETLTEFAEQSPEDIVYQNQVEAVEPLLEISEKAVADDGTTIYSLEGLQSQNFNPTAGNENSPDSLDAWKDVLQDEIESLGYETSIRYPPEMETPRIIVEFE